MAYMEQNKYLEPNISFSFEDLAVLLRSTVSCTDSTRLSNISNLDKLTIRDFNVKSLPTSPLNSKTKNFIANKTLINDKFKSKLNKDIKIFSTSRNNGKYRGISQNIKKKLTNFKYNYSESLLDPINIKKVDRLSTTCKTQYNDYSSYTSGSKMGKIYEKRNNPSTKSRQNNLSIYGSVTRYEIFISKNTNLILKLIELKLQWNK